MRKLLSCISLCLCLFARQSNAQNTYDVFTYTEPKGYVKKESRDYISFTKTDNKTAGYCIIGLYKQTKSSGKLSTDFDIDWKSIVMQMGVKNQPTKEIRKDIDGWQNCVGLAEFEFQGNTNMAMLITLTKENKKAAVLIVTNHRDLYTNDAEPFLEKLEYGNVMPEPQMEEKNSATTAKTNNELLGEWYLSDGNAKLGLYFFNDGKFVRIGSYESRVYKDLYSLSTTNLGGSYSLSGNTLILTPNRSPKETYEARIGYDTNSDGKQHKILYLKRPYNGQTVESEYWYVYEK